MDKLELNFNKNNEILDNIIILTDFDGTITKQDVNNEVFKKFNSNNFNNIEELLVENEISDKKALIENFKNIDEKKETIKNYIIKRIYIDPYFKQFIQFTKEKNIKMGIVSGGFVNYINWIFKKYNIYFDGAIYANNLIFKDNRIILEFLHNINRCKLKFGPCGNCKLKVINNIKANLKKIIYIGDGLTDRCIADKVDILFVKKDTILEKYCKKKSIGFIKFDNFNDILLEIKKIDRE